MARRSALVQRLLPPRRSSRSATTANGSSTPVDFQPSGFGWQRDGTLLVVVDAPSTACAASTPTARSTTHADISEYCGYWANDMVVAADGTAYVGNFGFDLDALGRGARHRRLSKGAPSPPTTNVVVALAPDGVDPPGRDEQRSRTGWCSTDDGATLIVAETMRHRLTAFDVAADGTLSSRRVFAQLELVFA